MEEDYRLTRLPHCNRQETKLYEILIEHKTNVNKFRSSTEVAPLSTNSVILAQI